MDNQREQFQSVLSDIKHKQKSAWKFVISTITMIGLVGASLLAYSIFQVNKQVESKNMEIAMQEEQKRELRTKLEAEKYIREGVRYAQSGNLSQAITAYNQAINIDSSSAEAYGLKGYALLRRGQIKKRHDDVEEAVGSLEYSVRLDSANVWSHYNLALAYWEFGDLEKAIQSVERVLNINQSFKDVITNDVQFRRFRIAPEFRKLLSQ